LAAPAYTASMGRFQLFIWIVGGILIPIAVLMIAFFLQ
jgi:hypothetical protein